MQYHGSTAGLMATLCAAFSLVACDDAEPEQPAEADAPAKANPEQAGPRIPGKADEARGPWYYTSASRVEALKGDLTGVSPVSERAFLGDPLSLETYLSPMSCLGHFGPIGEYGPLGLFGPAAGEIWSPSRQITGEAGWDFFSASVDESAGAPDRDPLGADGPLGSAGPLNPALWSEMAKKGEREATNGFVAQLAPGGVWGVLGPVGPLGALGPLGPLGPVGAHGYKADEDGQYVAEDGGDCWASDESGVCRTVEVEWTEGGELRTYDLFESYTEDFAAQMSDNDTSFMVRGRAEAGEADSFEFTASSDQFVTVLVVSKYARYTYAEAMQILGAAALAGYSVPSGLWTAAGSYHHYNSFSDFDLSLEIEADGESTTVESVSGDSVEWIQARVPAGAKMKVSVPLYQAWKDNWYRYNLVPEDYYLYVVGSAYISESPVTGPHQGGY